MSQAVEAQECSAFRTPPLRDYDAAARLPETFRAEVNTDPFSGPQLGA